MLFFIILPRFLWLLYILKKNKVQFVVTANYQANLAAKFWGIPNIVFNDDPRKGVIQIASFAADITYVTKGISFSGATELNCLKEWSYLAPKYLHPNIHALSELHLKPFGYIMVREVSTKTTNYSHQKAGELISIKSNPSYPVVISLEDKSTRNSVPADWIVLEEPVKDIHSLMFYSRGFVSSGDSMAREAAELGVPSYYAGSRDMEANKVLIDLGLMKHRSAQEAWTELNSLPNITDVQNEESNRQAMREKLASDWDDVNDVIKNHLIKLN